MMTARTPRLDAILENLCPEEKEGRKMKMKPHDFKFPSAGKFIKYLTGFVLVVLIAWGISTGFFTIVYGLAHQAYRSSLPVTVTHIAGQEYAIPHDYIMWGLRDKEDGFLIGVIYPSMKGVFSEKHVDKNTASHQIIVYAVDEASTTSFQFRWGVTQKQYGGLDYLDEEFGLKHYRAKNSHPQWKPTDDPTYKHEIFTDDLSAPSIFMDCGGDNSDASPGCELHFVDHSLLYQISFRKTKVSEWESIKDQTLKLVDGLR